MSAGLRAQHATPPASRAVYRLHFRRRHIVVCAALLIALFAGLFGLYVVALHAASADVSQLRTQRVEQQRIIDAMERQAQALQEQNTDSERSIERIERTLGAQRKRAAPKAPDVHASIQRAVESGTALAARLRLMARASAQTHARANHLAGLATRVLNLRHMASIARQRMIAAIPSLNPVNGDINAAFGWRTDPFPEFHKGLDLAAGYGTTVRAAAAGTIAAAGWAGDFGIKVDIDHGNGYHTWYCHLSRTAVSVGQHVSKGETIAAVGSTGESTGPHLHYQLMHEGVAIDPMPFLRGVPPKVMATLPLSPGVQ